MEKVVKPQSGWLALLLSLGLLGALIWMIVESATRESSAYIIYIILVILALILILKGLTAIEPNSSRVLTLFGKYVGTIKASGFFWVNPFYSKKVVSLRANNLDTKPIKVNDKVGNPIMIGAVVVWRVEDAYKAAFEVDHYQNFVTTQCESAIRQLAGNFAYDDFETEGDEEITLRSSAAAVNEMLEHEIQERLHIAGIRIVESRISHLAYSTEIAGAMLQRQQATAVVAARAKIVEGAVGMVEMALDELSKKSIVELDEERKAAMVSNLMVVLCSERGTQPIVNTGTLYQ